MSAKQSSQRKQIGIEFSIHQLMSSRLGCWSVGLVNSHHPTRAGPPDWENIPWEDEWFGQHHGWNSGVADWQTFFGEWNAFHDVWPGQASYALGDILPRGCVAGSTDNTNH